MHRRNSPHCAVSCPRCEISDSVVDYELEWKDARFPRYRILSCRKCGLSYVDPRPGHEQLSVLYDSTQYREVDAQLGNFWAMSEEEVAGRIACEFGFLQRYERWLPSSGKILDVGAGWGTLLKCFCQEGYVGVGIELSETAGRFARERLGLEVLTMGAEDLMDLHERDFDVVIVRHVLEHLPNPWTALGNIRALLKPDGIVIVVVPDYGSYDRRACGEKWPGFAPYHLWYFTRQSLRTLMKECGFLIVTFKQYVSKLVFPKRNASPICRVSRRLLSRIGGKRLFSGRSIGVIAKPA